MLTFIASLGYAIITITILGTIWSFTDTAGVLFFFICFSHSFIAFHFTLPEPFRRPKSLALVVLFAICNRNVKCQIGYSLINLNSHKNLRKYLI